MLALSNNWAKPLRRSAQQLHAKYKAVLGQNAPIARATPATSAALSTATTLLTVLGIDVVSSQLSLQILILSGYELFYLWLAESLLQHSYSHHGHGAHSKAGPSRGGRAAPPRDEPGDNPAKPAAKKRKRNGKGKGKTAKNNGDEDSDSDSDDNNMAVPPLAGHPRRLKPLLACPFLRLDPLRYFACADCDLRGYDAVKQHMERNHGGSFYCPQPRCFGFFETADERDTHIRGCTTDVPGHDGITGTEWDDVFNNPVDRCPRTNDDVRKYLWMWPRVFRGHTPPTPDEVFLQDIVVEAKKFLYSPEIILSVLETHNLLLLNQPATRALAEAVRDAFLAANPPPRYRVYHPGHDVQTADGEGPSGSSNTNSGPQPGGGPGAEPADADAELLRPVARYLGGPPQQAPLGHGDASSPSVRGPPVTIAGPSAGAGTSARPPAAEGSTSPAAATADDNPNLYRTVTMVPYLTIYAAWDDLQHYALSLSRLGGPSWADVRDCIDFDAWEAMWEAGSSLTYPHVVVPIHRNQAARFREMEARGLPLPVDPLLTDGGGGGESGGAVDGGGEVEQGDG